MKHALNIESNSCASVFSTRDNLVAGALLSSATAFVTRNATRVAARWFSSYQYFDFLLTRARTKHRMTAALSLFSRPSALLSVVSSRAGGPICVLQGVRT